MSLKAVATLYRQCKCRLLMAAIVLQVLEFGRVFVPLSELHIYALKW
jgi:hypothetical protein